MVTYLTTYKIGTLFRRKDEFFPFWPTGLGVSYGTLPEHHKKLGVEPIYMPTNINFANFIF